MTDARVLEGVVQEWNSSTGENAILINGGVVANVKSLTGESASLAAGDVVLVMSTGDRFYLLGKATTPGDPGTVPTWTADISSLTATVDTVTTVTIPAVQADVTVVQGDVVELNTVTVPAVQADADAAAAAASTAQGTANTAQTTANTAQSTATTAQSTATSAQADADAAVLAAAAAAADAAAAQAAADALQTDLDAAEADVAAVTADVATLTGTTLPALQSDVDAAAAAVVAAQADVDAILPIGTTDITDDAVTTAKIAANAITATEINAGAVTAVKIAADTITASQIAASAITASELAANAVTAGKIAAGTIVAADIAAGTITATQIAGNTITAAKIAAGTITAAEIAANAITASELDANAITGKTITGSLFRTATSGERIEVEVSGSGRMTFYTGAVDEDSPAALYVDAPTADQADMYVFGPEMIAAIPADIRLSSIQSTAKSSIGMEAWGPISITSNFVPAGDGSGGTMTLDSADDLTITAGGHSGAPSIANVAIVATGSVTVNGAEVMVVGGNPQPVEVVSSTTVSVVSPALTPTFVPGSPVCGVAFTAPATGSVYITVGGRFQNDTATNTTYLGYEVRTGGTVGSGTVFLAAEAGGRSVASGTAVSTRAGASRRRLVTGLTPGSSYNVRTMHAGQIATGGATFFNRELLVEPVL